MGRITPHHQLRRLLLLLQLSSLAATASHPLHREIEVIGPKAAAGRYRLVSDELHHDHDSATKVPVYKQHNHDSELPSQFLYQSKKSKQWAFAKTRVHMDRQKGYIKSTTAAASPVGLRYKAYDHSNKLWTLDSTVTVMPSTDQQSRSSDGEAQRQTANSHGTVADRDDTPLILPASDLTPTEMLAAAMMRRMAKHREQLGRKNVLDSGEVLKGASSSVAIDMWKGLQRFMTSTRAKSSDVTQQEDGLDASAKEQHADLYLPLTDMTPTEMLSAAISRHDARSSGRVNAESPDDNGVEEVALLVDAQKEGAPGLVLPSPTEILATAISRKLSRDVQEQKLRDEVTVAAKAVAEAEEKRLQAIEEAKKLRQQAMTVRQRQLAINKVIKEYLFDHDGASRNDLKALQSPSSRWWIWPFGAVLKVLGDLSNSLWPAMNRTAIPEGEDTSLSPSREEAARERVTRRMALLEAQREKEAADRATAAAEAAEAAAAEAERELAKAKNLQRAAKALVAKDRSAKEKEELRLREKKEYNATKRHRDIDQGIPSSASSRTYHGAKSDSLGRSSREGNSTGSGGKEEKPETSTSPRGHYVASQHGKAGRVGGVESSAPLGLFPQLLQLWQRVVLNVLWPTCRASFVLVILTALSAGVTAAVFAAAVAVHDALRRRRQRRRGGQRGEKGGLKNREGIGTTGGGQEDPSLAPLGSESFPLNPGRPSSSSKLPLNTPQQQQQPAANTTECVRTATKSTPDRAASGSAPAETSIGRSSGGGCRVAKTVIRTPRRGQAVAIRSKAHDGTSAMTSVRNAQPSPYPTPPTSSSSSHPKGKSPTNSSPRKEELRKLLEEKLQQHVVAQATEIKLLRASVTELTAMSSDLQRRIAERGTATDKDAYPLASSAALADDIASPSRHMQMRRAIAAAMSTSAPPLLYSEDSVASGFDMSAGDGKFGNDLKVDPLSPPEGANGNAGVVTMTEGTRSSATRGRREDTRAMTNKADNIGGRSGAGEERKAKDRESTLEGIIVQLRDENQRLRESVDSFLTTGDSLPGAALTASSTAAATATTAMMSTTTRLSTGRLTLSRSELAQEGQSEEAMLGVAMQASLTQFRAALTEAVNEAVAGGIQELRRSTLNLKEGEAPDTRRSRESVGEPSVGRPTSNANKDHLGAQAPSQQGEAASASVLLDMLDQDWSASTAPSHIVTTPEQSAKKGGGRGRSSTRRQGRDTETISSPSGAELAAQAISAISQALDRSQSRSPRISRRPQQMEPSATKASRLKEEKAVDSEQANHHIGEDDGECDGSEADADSDQHAVGGSVIACCEGDGEWYPATVLSKNYDRRAGVCTYDVLFEGFHGYPSGLVETEKHADDVDVDVHGGMETAGARPALEFDEPETDEESDEKQRTSEKSSPPRFFVDERVLCRDTATEGWEEGVVEGWDAKGHLLVRKLDWDESFVWSEVKHLPKTANDLQEGNRQTSPAARSAYDDKVSPELQVAEEDSEESSEDSLRSRTASEVSSNEGTEQPREDSIRFEGKNIRDGESDNCHQDVKTMIVPNEGSTIIANNFLTQNLEKNAGENTDTGHVVEEPQDKEDSGVEDDEAYQEALAAVERALQGKFLAPKPTRRRRGVTKSSRAKVNDDSIEGFDFGPGAMGFSFSSFQDVGVEEGPTGASIVVTAVDPKGPAGLSGISAGDLIVAVNGRMLPSRISKDDFFYMLLDMPRPIKIGFRRQQHESY